MLRPVNRSQSPISTTNPNAVDLEIPRRHPSRVTTAVNSESAAIVSMASSRRPRRSRHASIASKALS